MLILDADGQHLPEEIPRFLEVAGSGRFGLLKGNRMGKPDKMPWVRYGTNRLLSRVISHLIHQKVLDSQCGYKMLSTEFLKKAKLTADQFEIEDDILLEAGRLQVPIENVPVTSHYGEEISHIHPVKDTVRFLRFLWTWRRQRRTAGGGQEGS